MTYLLTGGGHNAGIVSEPGHAAAASAPHQTANDHYLDPDRFLLEAQRQDGSWWPQWTAWLGARSGPPTAPPQGAPDAGLPPLGDAPGSYVLQDEENSILLFADDHQRDVGRVR